MRLFFAIEFKEELKEYLSNVQKVIRQHCTGGNFTAKDNFHMTLRFIGEQNPEKAEKLISVLKETAENMTDFEIKLSKAGKFDRRNKKIIWIGLQKSKELEALYCELEKNLVNYGYNKEERSYNPHITLAREAEIEDFESLKDNIEINKYSIMVNSISLMESKRVDNKLCYIPLFKSVFKL